MTPAVGQTLWSLADTNGLSTRRRPAEADEAPEAEDEHSLDALVAPAFSMPMFVLQMVLHLFWPLSMIVYPSSRYPRGARNQNLDLHAVRRAPLIASFIQLGPLLCWGLLAVYVAFPRQFHRSSVTVDEIFFIPMVMLTARLVAIAVKYATLTSAELSRFMHASPENGEKFMSQMLADCVGIPRRACGGLSSTPTRIVPAARGGPRTHAGNSFLASYSSGTTSSSASC